MNHIANFGAKIIIALAICMAIVAILFSVYAILPKFLSANFDAFSQINGDFITKILIFSAIATLFLAIFTYKILGKGAQIRGSFWEHQRVAKSKIAWLNFLFFAMLALIFSVSFSLFWLILNFTNSNSPQFCTQAAAFLSFALIIIIFFAYIFKSVAMSKNSIKSIAATLNATQINAYSNNLAHKEQVLVNVISEMAIASNMSLPQIFIIEEPSINAMCSGENFGSDDEKIAIFVTRGALENFTRDELQGVIGHEFSHAFHGDVALNLKIFSLIFALNCIIIIGEFLVRLTAKSGSKRSKKGGGEVAIFLLIGVIFYTIGSFGAFFSQLIQAAISRQKEFLADSSSVQYTRNPDGIRSALMKIYAIQTNQAGLMSGEFENSQNSPKLSQKELSKIANNATKISNPNAKPCAHMFFASAFSSLFATHPSLKARIERLTMIKKF